MTCFLSPSSSAPRASIGLLLSGLVALASMSSMGCAPEEEVDLSCEVTPGLASETRVLELGRFVSMFVGEGFSQQETTFVPYADGEEVYLDAGGQGGRHLTTDMRFSATPEEGVEDRCVLISYQRRGDVGEDGEENFTEFVVQRRFRRDGDYWSSGVIDPGARFGSLNVVVSIEDNLVMGSSESSLVVVERP